MKAHKFVAEFGIEKAKEALSLCCWLEKSFCTRFWCGCIKNNHDCCVDVEKLKQVVESVELIKHIGGIECANQILEAAPNSWCFACADLRKKEIVRSAPSHNDFVYIAALEEAIADYELVESYEENQHV